MIEPPISRRETGHRIMTNSAPTGATDPTGTLSLRTAAHEIPVDEVVVGDVLVAGRPVRPLFRREETAACSEQVVLPVCCARLEADPERYLAGSEEKCCDGGHGHSPPSEWRCD